ncbi:MAG: tRNA pseudouridine(38-40) synthase TruA [Puniceicoccales bacterium]|jgi:tRNA pseudouridine38-40 synthase|nr:tRNA pseudouridine(38-40) synthase TruA [Puniceicoccales bacterium]
MTPPEENSPPPAVPSASAPETPPSAPAPAPHLPPIPPRRFALPPASRRRPDLAGGMSRLVCKVAYDGTDFLGWQAQRDGVTIQGALEARLAQIVQAPVRVHGSGRTDAGVHAAGQVFHFDAFWEHEPAVLLRALRTGLPRGIQVFDAWLGRPDFHARFSARGKRYRYRFFEGYAPPQLARYVFSLGERRLDFDAMREAAEPLLGVHDFSAFGGSGSDISDGENPVKDLRRLELFRRGPRIDLITEASGYLYKMVRRLAGGLMQVGLGRMTPAALLAYREARVSAAVVPSAPPCGLVMERVFYRTPWNAAPCAGALGAAH